MLNALQIAAQACGEMGYTIPSQLAGGNFADGTQILALLNREGKELARKPWPELRGEQLINLVVGQQAYPFPTDISFYRPGTSWDRSTHWRTVGPLSDREWQAIRSGIAVAAPFVRWRLYGGQIQFDPVPSVTDQIAFEYISNAWCKSSAGTPQTSFLADTDVPLLPDDLFILGLKWRLLAARGFNYTEEKAAYEAAVADTFAAEQAFDILDLGRQMPRISSFGFPAIPDGFWPGR